MKKSTTTNNTRYRATKESGGKPFGGLFGVKATEKKTTPWEKEGGF